ncbi:Nop25 domain-containing protein [Rhizoctonia solani AG-1 IA]|uniref:Nop25 domain-containing protein n=1 Tax=Thanatephorus cucumeris (strain AG1-IA) TaxID=983506 RepID=L8WQ62_THACA|nr:Nop25 domain-containing protein [Rhizoctonia solani AG-1 IA]
MTAPAAYGFVHTSKFGGVAIRFRRVLEISRKVALDNIHLYQSKRGLLMIASLIIHKFKSNTYHVTGRLSSRYSHQPFQNLGLLTYLYTSTFISPHDNLIEHCSLEMAPSNAALLTRQSVAWAHKKRARQGQVKEIVFDEEARREYLTGFRKRNAERKKAAKAKATEREKQEHLEERRQVSSGFGTIV